MAFHIQNWNRLSSSANEPLVNQLDPVTGVQTFRPGCYRVYNYYGVTYTAGAITGDSQATMQAAGYFNDVAYDLQVNDQIVCYSASENTYQTYQVTAISAAGVVTITALDGGVIQVALTAANMLAMNGAPVLVMAAPGANRAILVRNWSLTMSTGPGPVVYANGGAIGLEYTNTAALAGTLASATIPATVLTTGTPNNLGYAGQPAAFGIASALKANAPLYISNDTAAFINGDGTVLLTIDYRIVPA